MFRTPDNIYPFWQSQMVSRVEVTRFWGSDVRHGESLRVPAIGRSTDGAYHGNNNCASLETFYRNLGRVERQTATPIQHCRTTSDYESG